MPDMPIQPFDMGAMVCAKVHIEQTRPHPAHTWVPPFYDGNTFWCKGVDELKKKPSRTINVLFEGFVVGTAEILDGGVAIIGFNTSVVGREIRDNLNLYTTDSFSIRTHYKLPKKD